MVTADRVIGFEDCTPSSMNGGGAEHRGGRGAPRFQSGGGAVLAVLPAGDSAFEGCETAIDGGDDVSEAVDAAAHLVDAAAQLVDPAVHLVAEAIEATVRLAPEQDHDGDYDGGREPLRKLHDRRLTRSDGRCHGTEEKGVHVRFREGVRSGVQDRARSTGNFSRPAVHWRSPTMPEESHCAAASSAAATRTTGSDESRAPPDGPHEI